MSWPGFKASRSAVLVLLGAGLTACGTQKDPAAMIAAAYPRDSFVSCREVPDLRKASFFGYISVMRCIDKNPSRAILHTLSFDYPPDIVRTHNVAICFYIDGDLVGVHSYGYPDDPSLSKKVPCRPIHD